MNEQETDPELDLALQEIQGIVAKYDLGGFIALHNREGGQFKPFFPTWTTATFRPKGKDGGLALHFKVDIDSESMDNQDTVSMLLGIRDTCFRSAAIFEKVAVALAKHTRIDLTAMLAPKAPPDRPGTGH